MVDILQMLVLVKKRQGVRKKEEKGCGSNENRAIFL